MSDWRDLLKRTVRRKRFWGALVGALLLGTLSAYALYGVFRSDSQIAWRDLLGRVRVEMFLVSGLVYAVALLLVIIGWGWIIGALSGVWNWPQHARIYCITAITRRLPGTLWYMLGRIMLYERLGVSRALVVIGGGLEFALILVSGLFVALITWPLVLSGQAVNPAWFVIGLLVGCLILNPPVLRATVKRFSRQSTALQLRYRDLLGWALVYVGVWCWGGGVLFVLANTIHPLPWIALVGMIGIWAASGLIASLTTFVPFSVGVQELTLTALLSAYVAAPEALVIAVLMRITLTINEVLWALISGLIGLVAPLKLVQNEQSVMPGRDLVVPHPEAEKPEELYHITPAVPPK